MKYILLIIIGVLLYQSPDARNFTAQQLTNLAEFLRPNAQGQQPQQPPHIYY